MQLQITYQRQLAKNYFFMEKKLIGSLGQEKTLLECWAKRQNNFHVMWVEMTRKMWWLKKPFCFFWLIVDFWKCCLTRFNYLAEDSHFDGYELPLFCKEKTFFVFIVFSIKGKKLRQSFRILQKSRLWKQSKKYFGRVNIFMLI